MHVPFNVLDGETTEDTREPMRMITKNRPDFIYTLEDDERRCLASIEKAEQRFKERSKKTSVHR